MKILISEFHRNHLNRLALLVLNAWPHLYKKFPGKYAIRFSKAYIEYCKAVSTWNEILFVDNKLIGCIFCNPAKGISLKQFFKLFFLAVKYLILWTLGYFGKRNAFWGFVMANSKKEKLLIKNYQKLSYELSLVLIHTSYQGKGLGKKLICRFEKHAEKKGFMELVLTTDQLSNWQFYGKNGFYRSYKCFDPVSSYLDESNQSIFVYRKQL